MWMLCAVISSVFQRSVVLSARLRCEKESWCEILLNQHLVQLGPLVLLVLLLLVFVLLVPALLVLVLPA